MRQTVFLVVSALLLLLGGCMPGVNSIGAAEPMVRSQASSDLDCPDSEIRVIEELGGRYKAIGCGRKAYYQTACDGIRCVVESGDGKMIPWRERPEMDTAAPPR